MIQSCMSNNVMTCTTKLFRSVQHVHVKSLHVMSHVCTSCTCCVLLYNDVTMLLYVTSMITLLLTCRVTLLHHVHVMIWCCYMYVHMFIDVTSCCTMTNSNVHVSTNVVHMCACIVTCCSDVVTCCTCVVQGWFMCAVVVQ